VDGFIARYQETQDLLQAHGDVEEARRPSRLQGRFVRSSTKRRHAAGDGALELDRTVLLDTI